ncbi:MAG: molybdopterin cofactor-binding domain-containing protein, partial [Hyphomicrobium sp.]
MISLSHSQNLHMSEHSTSPQLLPRRRFLQLAVGTGSGLILGTYWPPIQSLEALTAFSVGPPSFNPFIKITTDNKVIVISKHLEMGQGSTTGLATLVAEELDADWQQMEIESAPANLALYKNLFFGTQGTGGSTAIANSFEQYRMAGAAARHMFLQAAAKKWNVDPSKVSISKGVLTDGTNKAIFGDLANAAAQYSPPDAPKLKDPKDFIYIGKFVPRLDQKSKATAQPIFTQDLVLPDMLVAVVARPPRFGATAAKFDPSKSKAIKNVVAVVEIPQGIAVVATSTWAALKGRDALDVSWEESKAEKRGSKDLLEEYRVLANTKGAPVVKKGDAE